MIDWRWQKENDTPRGQISFIRLMTVSESIREAPANMEPFSTKILREGEGGLKYIAKWFVAVIQ